ncbi:MAG TPA: DNA/RNA non-specific endonuclease [Opitutaceae bacterium]
MAKRKSSSRGGSRRGFRLQLAFWFNLALLALLAGWFALQPPVRRAEVGKLVENYFEKNKRIELFDIARDIYQLYYSAEFVRAEPPAGDRTHLYGGVPRHVTFPHPVRVLANRGYLVGYCEALESPVWAAYRVADISRLLPPAPRPERFETDVRTAARVSPEDYTGSGYDRGHLAPNYAIATRYGEEAQRETFLMSNIIPQRHTLNAGPWKDLEMKTATSYPGRFGEVWVIVGPVFGAHPETLRNGTAIPDAGFMILIDESDGRVRLQALLLPQDTPAGADLDGFLTTVDEIERRTGLDFLSELEDSAENQLEANRAGRVW